MKKTGSRLLFYVFLIFIVLGCAKSQPYPIKLDLSGPVRPEAVTYLHGLGITLGNYRDLSGDGIYETVPNSIILRGNRVTYIVKGDVEGNLFAMVLEMEVENANSNTVVQTRQILTIMLAEIYKAIDAGEVPLEIMQPLVRHYRLYRKFKWKISDDYYLILKWAPKVIKAMPGDPFKITITIRRALN